MKGFDRNSPRVNGLVHCFHYVADFFGWVPSGLAGPVAWFPLWSWVVAVMSGAEILSAVWVVAFDFHVGVAEVHLHDVAVFILGVDGEFLRAVRSSEGFVEFYFAAFVFGL